MYRSGFDYFTASPYENSQRICPVCGTRCDVRRGVMGPTCLADAVFRRSRLHDEHACPHAGQPWHDRAVSLQQEIERCPSPRVSKLVRQDLDDLLAEHGLTSFD